MKQKRLRAGRTQGAHREVRPSGHKKQKNVTLYVGLTPVGGLEIANMRMFFDPQDGFECSGMGCREYTCEDCPVEDGIIECLPKSAKPLIPKLRMGQVAKVTLVKGRKFSVSENVGVHSMSGRARAYRNGGICRSSMKAFGLTNRGEYGIKIHIYKRYKPIHE